MNSEIIYHVDQRSPEWFALREKRLTASHAQAIATNGKGLVTYVNKKMAAYYSTNEKDFYVNADIQRGIDLEPEAAAVYAWEYNVATQIIGFVIRDDYSGASPDLFESKDGVVEIKCLNNENHFNLLMGGKFETKYVWQGQALMLICEKRFCKLVSYNPNFDKSLVVKTIEPDQKKFDKLLDGFESGKAMIKEIESKIK